LCDRRQAANDASDRRGRATSKVVSQGGTAGAGPALRSAWASAPQSAIKEPLGQIYRRFREQHATELTLAEFFGIVWLPNQHSIVLDSRNFKGMLGGVSAIG